MRFILFLILLLFVVSGASAQTSYDNQHWRQTVLSEISTEQIEDLYLGCSDCLSESRIKADSLFKRISLDTALAYLQSQSYTVKYYSFLRVMVLDESLAFELLKRSILDSTNLDI